MVDLLAVSKVHLDFGQRFYIRIFTLAAVFILLIACFNYMNLATARSATRSQEVGVRKVVGARRNHLVYQFLGESVLTAALALIPLALGGGEAGKEIQSPMAIVILGGLFTSTALNMIVVPAIFMRLGEKSL